MWSTLKDNKIIKTATQNNKYCFSRINLLYVWLCKNNFIKCHTRFKMQNIIESLMKMIFYVYVQDQ
jgi:hypothetical protein